MWARPTGGRLQKAGRASSHLFVGFISLCSAAPVGVVVAAEPQTQQMQPAKAPPGQTTPAPAAVSGKVESNTDLGGVFLIALVQEIPKLATTLIGLGLAWQVGLRITADWDMRKKRGEFNILLSKEFYAVVATFKAVAREWEALLVEKPAPPPADQQNQTEANQKKEAWEASRHDLARRALDAETNMESILLKLVTEELDFDRAAEPEQKKRQRSLSLFRLAFRNLREMIETGTSKPPGWTHPEFWLFNRLSAEISHIIYQRSVNVPAQIANPTLPVKGESYLDLLALRTADLRFAAARLKPSVEDFLRRREHDRLSARQGNIRRLFRAEALSFANVLPAARRQGAPPAALRQLPNLAPTQTLAAEVAEQNADRARAQDASQALFASSRSLTNYLVLFANDIALFSRDAERQVFGATDNLPVTLPWSPRPRGSPAIIGADLLAWDLQPETRTILGKIASESLT